MAGNVKEWVADWYEENYYDRSPRRNPQGPARGEFRGVRGGSWSNDALNIRVADRIECWPDVSIDDFDCRCAQD